jgi:hypothetical protein
MIPINNEVKRLLWRAPWLILLLLIAAWLLVGCEGTNPEGTTTPPTSPPITSSGGTPRPGDLIPLNDLGSGTYLGFEGGLYPGGRNEMPAEHSQAGLERAGRIQPLTAAGNPSVDGKYILLSIGLSNAGQVFCGSEPTECRPTTFGGQAAQSAEVEHEHLVIVNGAIYGESAADWDTAGGNGYNQILNQALEPLRLGEAQVQIVWLRVTNSSEVALPSLPDPQADAYLLLEQLGNVVRALRARYPNLQQVYITSRGYAGYANGADVVNGEPHAYESALAVKWLIEAQIDQMAGNSDPALAAAGNLDYNRVAPWLAWGPYLWANGAVPRTDGLAWVRADFEGAGLRLSTQGVQKVGTILFDFFRLSPHSQPWFLAGSTPIAVATIPPATEPASTPATSPPPSPTVPAAPPTPTAGTAVVVTNTPPVSSGNDSQPIPLIDMGTTATYYGFTGGLYPNGSNEMPLDHALVGLARANLIQPLDAAGNPSPTGKYALLAVGMSNAAREFGIPGRAQNWTFIGMATADSTIDHANLMLINGARSGQVAADWEEANHYNYNWIRENQLTPNGLTESQVQVIWMKMANGDATTYPSLPSPQADAYVLLRRMGNILRSLKQRYPNLQQVFISSRVYAGYAGEDRLNPEPYAYESGFAVKWLIEAQIQQMATGEINANAGDLNYNTVAPWIAWGPYMWADGLNPRSDGLIWERDDFAGDGTHPYIEGQRKVANMLMSFFKNAAMTPCWFLSEGVCQSP